MTGLLAFVAINTLVFLGLSAAKAMPWPEPIPPALLRSTRDGRSIDSDEISPTAARSTTLRQRALLALVALLCVPAGPQQRGKADVNI